MTAAHIFIRCAGRAAARPAAAAEDWEAVAIGAGRLGAPERELAPTVGCSGAQATWRAAEQKQEEQCSSLKRTGGGREAV